MSSRKGSNPLWHNSMTSRQGSNQCWQKHDDWQRWIKSVVAKVEAKLEALDADI
jgi:hypothetical protein